MFPMAWMQAQFATLQKQINRSIGDNTAKVSVPLAVRRLRDYSIKRSLADRADR